MPRGVKGSGKKAQAKKALSMFNTPASTINLMIVANAADMPALRRQLDLIESMCGQLDIKTKHMNVTGSIT